MFISRYYNFTQDQSGIVILQSLSGTEQARTQHLQQYCVDFKELLTAFKILFGPYGPKEYQEVRRQARQDGHWPWQNAAGEQQCHSRAKHDQ